MAKLPLNVDSRNKTLTELITTTRATDNLLYDNTQLSFTAADNLYYNKSAVTPTYKVKDIVLLYDEHVPAGKMRKLHCFYRPVKIVSVYHTTRIG